MSRLLRSLWRGGEESRSEAARVEARLRANWLVERLAAALGVPALDHPVPEVGEVTLRYLCYRDVFIDVYLEVEKAGLARGIDCWVLILSSIDGLATRTYRGLNLLPAIHHIVRFSHDHGYRRRCLDQTR